MIREAYRADRRGFILGLLAVPPVLLGLYALLVFAIVAGQP